MVTLNWINDTKKIDDLIPNKKNPRKISSDRLDKLRGRIKDLGFYSPIILDFDGKSILAGHQRLVCLKDLNYNEVDVRIPSRELTQEEKDKILVADNVSWGDYDWDILNSSWGYDNLEAWGLEIPKLEDIDFDNIESNEDREKKFKEMTVTCPKCKNSFEIEV